MATHALAINSIHASSCDAPLAGNAHYARVLSEQAAHGNVLACVVYVQRVAIMYKPRNNDGTIYETAHDHITY